MKKEAAIDLSPQVLRVIFDDAKGEYVASLVGVDGVVGRGKAWGDAVSDLRLSLQMHLNADPSLSATFAAAAQFSGRFSIRVPVSVHRALDAAATSEGVSLNAYVSAVLAERVGLLSESVKTKKPPPAVAEEALIAMADSENRDSIGAATRIAYGVFHETSASIGLALAGLLGDRVAALEGPARATEHYGKFAWRAHKAGYTALALVFWRRALRFQPDNVKSASAYGQVLYKLGRFEEALEPLSRAIDRDGRLTYMKAKVQIAEPGANGVDSAILQKISEIMKEWAYGNESPEEAAQWRAHLADLDRSSRSELQTLLQELRTFVATYSRWK